MIDLHKDRPWVVFLFLFSLFVFTRSLSIHGVEYRDDEIFYYQSTHEMLQDGNLLSPTYFGENRFQKPILFYWFVLAFYKIFGVNWFAARLTAACFAAFSVSGTYLLARRFFSRQVSLLSSFILMSLPLFLRHAKNVVPDMALQFFILVAIYYGVCYVQDRKKNQLYLFYVTSGLGFMVKGLAALVVPLGALIIFILGTKRARLKDLEFLKGLGIWLVIILPWFLFMIALHGRGYFEYMVVEETKNRIVGTDGTANPLLVQGGRFLQHGLFYARTVLSYFLPWSLIGLAAFPILLGRWKKIQDAGEKEGLLLCLGWIILVFFIFSNMYFKISHYMLPICAPFSVVVSYFMLDLFKNESKAQAQLQSWLRIFILLILGLGFFVYSFLFVFLAQNPHGWLVLFILVYVAVVFWVVKTRHPATAALILSLYILFVFSQSGVMAQAGVSSHGILQRFAQTIHQRSPMPAVIGVGSHDIHEKEFQVYFDTPLIKAGHSHSGRMQLQLRELFDRKEEVYCLLTQKDYNEYSSLFSNYPTEVMEREFMVRKRMKLDQGFLTALFRLDGPKVREYLLEEIVLLRKRPE